MHHKNETRPACEAVPGSLGVAQAVSHHDSEVEVVKRRERLRAGLARRGFGLQQLPDGAWLVFRWDRSNTLDDLHMVEQFLKRAGGAER